MIDDFRRHDVASCLIICVVIMAIAIVVICIAIVIATIRIVVTSGVIVVGSTSRLDIFIVSIIIVVCSIRTPFTILVA